LEYTLSRRRVNGNPDPPIHPAECTPAVLSDKNAAFITPVRES